MSSWAEARAAALAAARDDWEAQVAALREVTAGAADACARPDARLPPLYPPLCECITSLRSAVARAACAAVAALAGGLEAAAAGRAGDEAADDAAAAAGERYEAEQLASALTPALLSAANQSLAVLREDALAALVGAYAATGGSRSAVERCAATAAGDPAPRRRLAAAACLEEGVRVWPRAATRRAAPTLLAVASAQAGDGVEAVRAAGRRLFAAAARAAPEAVEQTIEGTRRDDPLLAAKLERWAADEVGTEAAADAGSKAPARPPSGGSGAGRSPDAAGPSGAARTSPIAPSALTTSTTRLLRRPAARLAPAGQGESPDGGSLSTARASAASPASSGSPPAQPPSGPITVPFASAFQQDDLASSIEASFAFARRARRSIGGAALRVAVRRANRAEAAFPASEVAEGDGKNGLGVAAAADRLASPPGGPEAKPDADSLPSSRGREGYRSASRAGPSRDASPASRGQPSARGGSVGLESSPPLACRGPSRGASRAASPAVAEPPRGASLASPPSDQARGWTRPRPGEQPSDAGAARQAHGRSAYAAPLAVLGGALAPWAERCAAFRELEAHLRDAPPPKAAEEKLCAALIAGCSDAHARVATAALRALAALLDSPHACVADPFLERLVPLVFSRSVDAASDVRRAAASTREALAPRAASEPLGAALAKTLVATKSPKVIAVLLQHLQASPPALLCVRNGGPSASASAAHALGILRTLHLALERLTEDRAPLIRAEASKALRALDAAERRGMLELEEGEPTDGAQTDAAVLQAEEAARDKRRETSVDVEDALRTDARAATADANRPSAAPGRAVTEGTPPSAEQTLASSIFPNPRQNVAAIDQTMARLRIEESTQASPPANRVDALVGGELAGFCAVAALPAGEPAGFDSSVSASPCGEIESRGELEDQVHGVDENDGLDASPDARDEGDDLDAALAEALGAFDPDGDARATRRGPAQGVVSVTARDLEEEERRLTLVASKLSATAFGGSETPPAAPAVRRAATLPGTNGDAQLRDFSASPSPTEPVSFTHSECTLVSSIAVDGAGKGAAEEGGSGPAACGSPAPERREGWSAPAPSCPHEDDSTAQENCVPTISISPTDLLDCSTVGQAKAITRASLSPAHAKSAASRAPFAARSDPSNERFSGESPNYSSSGCSGDVSLTVPLPEGAAAAQERAVDRTPVTGHGPHSHFSVSLLLASQEGREPAGSLLELLRRVEAESTPAVALQALQAATRAAAGVLREAGW